MKHVWAYLIKWTLIVLYQLIKLVTRVDPHKIVFLGRRMNKVPLDFKLLTEELQQREPGIKATVLSSRYLGGLRESVEFAPTLLKSLYHLATSKVCVLDSYWPAVSMLPHREDLVVYQLWHSLGKIKQSGLQTLGRAQGRDFKTADVMQMHQGYDYVLAGAEIWNPNYIESFGVEESQLLNYGLPRADYLVNQRHNIAARIKEKYPALAEKPVILYAPTFRRGIDAEGALRLAEAIDSEQYNLVIKMHGSDSLIMPDGGHVPVPDFSATDLLTIADYLITDYSSIALEAAILDVNTFYYVYDREEYLRHNGLNIDLDIEMPGCVFESLDELKHALSIPYPTRTLRAYKQKFIIDDLGHSTADLADHILTVGELCPRQFELLSTAQN
ncbi:hypothetical protein GT020_12180 [Glutamicibacter soli]|uniref:CDP-glycerol--glycerophosphate glycerophosphotransferase n=1 Tax=Glutamicibacter soli TaxID=453836 RepID=A0A6L9G4X9_9MICC|nr:CDP-glycerol glycerophosphotransferase family protein [Glutamicibacter soli]NAZ16811.1 hypothetical protein [Glutamicibacter soli]